MVQTDCCNKVFFIKIGYAWESENDWIFMLGIEISILELYL